MKSSSHHLHLLVKNNEQQFSIYFHTSTCLFPSLEASWESSQTEKVRQTSSCHAKHRGFWLLDKVWRLSLFFLFWSHGLVHTYYCTCAFAHLVISAWGRVFLKGVWAWDGSDPVRVSGVIFSIPAGTVWHSSATQIRNDGWVTDEWRTLCVTWMHFPSLFLLCFICCYCANKWPCDLPYWLYISVEQRYMLIMILDVLNFM